MYAYDFSLTCTTFGSATVPHNYSSLRAPSTTMHNIISDLADPLCLCIFFLSYLAMVFPRLHFCSSIFMHLTHTFLMVLYQCHCSQVLLGSSAAVSLSTDRPALMVLPQSEIDTLSRSSCHLTGFSWWLWRHSSISRGTTFFRCWFQLSNISNPFLNSLAVGQNIFTMSEKHQTHLHQNFNQMLTDKQRQILNGENFSFKLINLMNWEKKLIKWKVLDSLGQVFWWL